MSISCLTPQVFSLNQDRFMAKCLEGVTLLCETGGEEVECPIEVWRDTKRVRRKKNGQAAHHKHKPQRIIHSSLLKRIRRLAGSSLSRSSSVICFAIKTSANSPEKQMKSFSHKLFSSAYILHSISLHTGQCTVISMRKSLCCARLHNIREKLEEDDHTIEEARRQTYLCIF